MMTGTEALFKAAPPSVPGGAQADHSEPAHTRFLTAYAAGLASVALLLLGLLVADGYSLSSHGGPWPIVAFMALAMMVERQSIRLTASAEISVGFLPLAFVAVVFGPLAAAAVGVAALLGDFPLWNRARGRREAVESPYIRWVVWTANRALDGAVAGLAAHAVLSLPGDPAFVVGAATAVATIIIFGFDLVVTCVTLVVRRTGRPVDVLREAGTMAVAGIPIYTAVAGLLAYAYIEVAPISAAFFFLPALAAHRLLVLSQRRQQALMELGEAFRRLESANLSFATALVATLDARDRYTAGHSTAVATYARDIARELDMNPDEQQVIHLCGLVHDIGKIGLPPGLLEKPGALTPLERRQMEEHSAIGERILANVDDYGDIARIVRHHHERVDGTGYPDGLGFEEIPRVSRILAVADAYDAMTSDRPYRAALSEPIALGRLRDGAGSQFDPAIVDAFERVVRARGTAYTTAARTHNEEREPSLVALAV